MDRALAVLPVRAAAALGEAVNVAFPLVD